MINFYTELKLNPELNGEQLETELKKLFKKWTRAQNAPNEEVRNKASKKLKYVIEAQEILLDEEKREEYDSKLQSQHGENEASSGNSNKKINENENRVDVLLKNAWDLINNDKYADAIIYARKATELAGDDGYAWFTLGYADYSWGNIEEAIYEYKKAIRLEPNNDGYYYFLSSLYFECDNFEQAEMYIDKALKLNPKETSNRYMKAQILVQNKGASKAIDILVELIEENPENEDYKEFLLPIAYKFTGLMYEVDKEKEDKVEKQQAILHTIEYIQDKIMPCFEGEVGYEKAIKARLCEGFLMLAETDIKEYSGKKYITSKEDVDMIMKMLKAAEVNAVFDEDKEQVEEMKKLAEFANSINFNPTKFMIKSIIPSAISIFMIIKGGIILKIIGAFIILCTVLNYKEGKTTYEYKKMERELKRRIKEDNRNKK